MLADPSDLTVTDVLREKRRAARATQQEIADLLGVDRSTYSYYETGKLRVPIQILNRLAQYYEMPVSEFFQEKNRPAVFQSQSAEALLGKKKDPEAFSYEYDADEGEASLSQNLTPEELHFLSLVRAASCFDDEEAVMRGEYTQESYDDEVLQYFADLDYVLPENKKLNDES